MANLVQIGTAGDQPLMVDPSLLAQAMGSGGGGPAPQTATPAAGNGSLIPVQVGQTTLWASSPQDAINIAKQMSGGGGTSTLIRTVADAANTGSSIMQRLNLSDLQNQMWEAEDAADEALQKLKAPTSNTDPNLIAYLEADRLAMQTNDQVIADAASRALLTALTSGAETVADLTQGFNAFNGGGMGGGGGLGAGLLGLGAGVGLGALLFDRNNSSSYGPNYQGNVGNGGLTGQFRRRRP